MKRIFLNHSVKEIIIIEPDDNLTEIYKYFIGERTDLICLPIKYINIKEIYIALLSNITIAGIFFGAIMYYSNLDQLYELLNEKIVDLTFNNRLNLKKKVGAMSKFGKNRSVDPLWLNVPTGYCTKVKGKRENVYNKYEKEFTVVQFYGNKALCGWRNTLKCSMGMTFLCPIIEIHNKKYIKYKNQLIDIAKDISWVF